MKLTKNTLNFEASSLAAPSGAGDANYSELGTMTPVPLHSPLPIETVPDGHEDRNPSLVKTNKHITINTAISKTNFISFILGAGDANYLRPLYDQILTEFIKLMKAYQTLEENNDIDMR